jgi:hypothetical protein
MICGDLELNKPVFQRLLGVAMHSPPIPPKNPRGATGAEAIGIAVVVVLALGYLGFMEFKNVLVGPKSGGYVNISAIVGD